MEVNMDYKEARDLLSGFARPVTTQCVDLEEASGRILAEDIAALRNVPAFDRSPYDGYAFMAKDTVGASRDNPVTLRIVEEVPAGSVPSKIIVSGQAVKVMTGTMIPEGADAVVMFEKTSFDVETVTLFEEARPGDNIIYAGEDVKKGSVLAKCGSVIDAGLSGALASQGIFSPQVFRKPVAGIISTGSELVDDALMTVPDGKIFNTNRYSLAAALRNDGCVPVYLGTADDDVKQIADLILSGFNCERKGHSGNSEQGKCDIIFLTGGVSAGDFDLTPAAVEMAGASLLVKGVKLKPGMACCYGEMNGKLICGLSGNPASALTNYYAVVRPALRKLAGHSDYLPNMFTVTLGDDFNKKIKLPRILKGKLEISGEGLAVLRIPSGQGNTMISSFSGCNCLAEIKAGSGPLAKGARLPAFLTV